MKITECLWIDKFVDKIIRKHNIYPEEVEEVFSKKPLIRRIEGGNVKGEDFRFVWKNECRALFERAVCAKDE